MFTNLNTCVYHGWQTARGTRGAHHCVSLLQLVDLGLLLPNLCQHVRHNQCLVIVWLITCAYCVHVCAHACMSFHAHQIPSSKVTYYLTSTQAQKTVREKTMNQNGWSKSVAAASAILRISTYIHTYIHTQRSCLVQKLFLLILHGLILLQRLKVLGRPSAEARG